MKLPWRYTWSCVLLMGAGIAVYIIWHGSGFASVKMCGISNNRTNSAGLETCSHDTCPLPLTCQEIEEVELREVVGEGAVKKVHLGQWQGMKVAYSSLIHSQYLPDFLHGAEMLQMMQSSRLAVRLLGLCLDANPPVIVSEYHEHGSADKINHVFSEKNISDKNNIRTRFQICLDYVEILSYLHSPSTGPRIMCDSNDIGKTLSQFLITSDLHLVVNDLDALPFVDRAQGKLAKCGHRQLHGDFVAPEQLWPFPDEEFRDEDMPLYDEKTDIWKIPDVIDALLGDVAHSNVIRLYLFKIHRRCKEIDPALRPTAEEILKEYQKVFNSVVLDG